MTLLSIVLPCYKVQGYLRQCLDSLLAQSFTDFEIIAVDDRSPDYSGEILAEYAAKDARVRVVTPPENLGLGRARNLGLDHATGEYVWFVDSDDWMAEGALEAAAARLRETDADMLVVGWDRVHWDGVVEAGSAVSLLSGAPDVFTLDEWPAALRILHVAWNRIVRRDLLIRLAFRFEAGWYEDVSFTFPMLVAAKRMSTLPMICVHYRQRRTGAITRTVGDRHFEVFGHWERALALCDEYGQPSAEVRGWMFRQMIWHYMRVIRHATRVPHSSRERFFRRMAENYQRYLPPDGFPMPTGRGERIRFELLARGNYPAFRAFDVALKSRAKLRSPGRWAKQIARQLRSEADHPYYRAQLRLPVDESLVLYAAYWYRGVDCNPAAIAAKAAELAPHLRAVWVVNPGVPAPPGTEFVVAGTRQYYRALARARYLVNNVNWPNWIVKRPGTTHVMTHHGTPLKVMGLDQIDHPAGAKDKDFDAQMRRADRWDFSVTANAYSTIAWERAYPCAHETIESGYPRNDRLALASAADKAAARERLGFSGQFFVLYAPTHREYLPRASQQVLDVAKLAERLGPDTVLIDRAHYFNTDGSRPSIEDLYLAADVLITDYSSAMFDFAVLDRPIVIFAPDWAEYSEKRGVYFDLMELPPGPVATDESTLAEIFATGAYSDEKSTAARLAFRAKFCYLDDGAASERVVRRVFLRGNS